MPWDALGGAASHLNPFAAQELPLHGAKRSWRGRRASRQRSTSGEERCCSLLRFVRLPGGQPTSHRCFDLADHTFGIGQNVGVPETEHFQAVPSEPSRARHIVADLFGIAVLRTIQLNHEARREAHKISEVRTERKLPTEANIADSFAAQMPPESF